jgi:glycosyltransferase involved in cell wall biosynthesis
MKIVAFIQMYNEASKGNLERCLKNCKQWADEIVIYDDASTDNSVAVAKKYTKYIIQGVVNDFCRELAHKQQLLEYAFTLDPDWIMWVDCDEILDRAGTLGGLRRLAEEALADVDAFSFHQTNLWRGQTYYRVDTLFDIGWFVRLWRVQQGLEFFVEEGLHRTLYPKNIKNVVKSDIRVIHYGFWHYKNTLKHIGAMPETGWTKETFASLAPDNWILNETECKCIKVPTEWFPEENIPEDKWEEPLPRTIESLKSYEEIDG